MSSKRKRQGSVQSDQAESLSPPEPLVSQDASSKAVAETTKAIFTNGAALHQALKTTSADALKLALTQLRAQISFRGSEELEASPIAASDKRIQLVKEYCEMCESEAGVSSSAAVAAKSIFSSWELAEKHSLPTLLPLPIFCLAQTLSLLSFHFPTHTLGENIVNKLLSPTEPWFGLLQNHVSNVGSAGANPSGKARHVTSKAADVAAMASLRLLREMASFGRGRFASKVFESFNWGIKTLSHLYSMRRRNQQSANKRKLNLKDAQVSLRRPDLRTLYILFLLSFLSQTYSSSLKVRLLDLGKDYLPGMLKGLAIDPPDVVQIVLTHFHQHLLRDNKVPRSKKIGFWNEWACGCIVKLYAREQDTVVLETSQGEQSQGPSVADLAHHFLLSICTNPGFGICYADRGWYPRQASAPLSDKDDTNQQAEKVKAVDDLIHVEQLDTEPQAKSQSGGGTIYNKVLSGVLKQLAVTDDLRQQELALRILKVCPELAGAYLESSCGGLTTEPRPSSKWLCNAAFFHRVVGSELPSFKNAKLDRVEDQATKASNFYDSYSAQPPPQSTVINNTLPTPLSRHLFTSGIHHPDRLVKYTSCSLLCRCLEKLANFRQICDEAAAQLDEDDNGLWRTRSRELQVEARKRVPDISNVIQLLQSVTNVGSSSSNEPSGPNADTNLIKDKDSEDDSQVDTATSSVSTKSTILLTEVTLRLLWLYHLAIPSSAFDSRFNVGKLLTNSFMSSVTHRVTLDEDGEPQVLNLQALCQIHALRIVSLSTDLSFDWSAKSSGQTGSGGGTRTYLGLLLTVYLSTPLEQVRTSCQELFDKLISPSALFEHNPQELLAWLDSLPKADTKYIVERDQQQHLSEEARHSSDPFQTLSREQQIIVSFLDECVQRCIKTPYRYIESARQFLAQHSVHDQGLRNATRSDLLASPLFMTMFEQFTIRASKGLFDTDSSDDETAGKPTINALLAFFTRLLPNLVACGSSFVAIQVAAKQIADSAVSHQPSSNKTSEYLSKVLNSSVTSIGKAPRLDLTESLMDEDVSESFVSSCSTPEELRIALRSSLRPLAPSNITLLWNKLAELRQKGFHSASDLLNELDPFEENVSKIAINGSRKVKFGCIPLLHLAAGLNVETSDETSPFGDQEEADASSANRYMDSWSVVTTKLAALVAIERFSNNLKADDDDMVMSSQLEQSVSLLRSVAFSGQVSTEDLGQLVFGNPALLSSISESTQASPLLTAVARIALDVLDPTAEANRRLINPLVSQLLSSLSSVAGFETLRLEQLQYLAPFVDQESLAIVVTQLLNHVKETIAGGNIVALEAILQTLHLAVRLGCTQEAERALVSNIDLLSRLLPQFEPGSEEANLLINLLNHILSLRSARSLGNISLSQYGRTKPSKQSMEEVTFDIHNIFDPSKATGDLDRLVVQATFGSQTNAQQVAEKLVAHILASSDESLCNFVMAIPFALRGSLDLLARVELAKDAWSEEALRKLTKACLDVLQQQLKNPNLSQVVPLAECVSSVLQYTFQSEIVPLREAILESIQQLITDCHPREALQQAPLLLVTSLLKHSSPSSNDKVNDIVQSMLDQSLLWLVRRFAEDENDSRQLVSLIEMFTDFVKAVTKASGVTTAVLKPHLVDPVIQTALKNRMLGVKQMKLVLTLSERSPLKVAQRSKYLATIIAHSEFGAIAGGTAPIMPPLDAEDDEEGPRKMEEEKEEDERTNDDQQEQQELRLTLVKTIHAMVSIDPSSLLTPALLTKLMGVYRGSLSEADRTLLRLFRSFEEECGCSFLSLARHWAAPASSLTMDALTAQNRVLDALLSIDSNMAFATCCEFPRCIPLKQSSKFGFAVINKGSKTSSRAALNEGSQESLGQHGDPSTLYDPVFLLSLLAGTLAEQKVTGLQWVTLLRVNALGVVVCCLSSRCQDIRQAALIVLGKCFASILSAEFQEKPHLVLILDLLRNCLAEFDPQLNLSRPEDPAAPPPPSLPVTTTLFIAHCLRALSLPSTFIYPIVTHFLLQRSELDPTDVPLLYNLLYSSTERHRQERIWMLRFLRDCARSGGRSDWRIFKRRHVWDLLASLYDSTWPSESISGFAALRGHVDRQQDETVRRLIEDTLFWLVQIPNVAIELVTRRGLLTWIRQQQVKHSSTISSASTRGTVWTKLVSLIISQSDLDLLDRATDYAWRSTCLAILETTTVQSLVYLEKEVLPLIVESIHSLVWNSSSNDSLLFLTPTLIEILNKITKLISQTTTSSTTIRFLFESVLGLEHLLSNSSSILMVQQFQPKLVDLFQSTLPLAISHHDSEATLLYLQHRFSSLTK